MNCKILSHRGLDLMKWITFYIPCDSMKLKFRMNLVNIDLKGKKIKKQSQTSIESLALLSAIMTCTILNFRVGES